MTDVLYSLAGYPDIQVGTVFKKIPNAIFFLKLERDRNKTVRFKIYFKKKGERDAIATLRMAHIHRMLYSYKKLLNKKIDYRINKQSMRGVRISEELLPLLRKGSKITNGKFPNKLV